MYRLLLILVFPVVGGFTVYGQSDYRITQYGPEDGLPSSEVYKVHAAKSGYLWLLTDRGVCRFDGRNFKVYNTKNNIGVTPLYTIAEDQRGCLWFCGYNGETYTYSPETDLIKRFKGSEILIDKVGSFIKKIVIDTSGYTFIPTNQSKPSLVFKKVQDKWVWNQLKVNQSEFQRINKEYECLDTSIGDPNNPHDYYVCDTNVIIITDRRKLIEVKDAHRIVNLIEDLTNVVTDMDVDVDGSIWVATLTDGIFKIAEKYIYNTKFEKVGDFEFTDGKNWVASKNNSIFILSKGFIRELKFDGRITYISNAVDEPGMGYFDLDGSQSFQLNLSDGGYKRLNIFAISDTFNGRFKIGNKLSQLTTSYNDSILITFPASGTGFYVIKNMDDYYINHGLQFYPEMEKVNCRQWIGKNLYLGTFSGLWRINFNNSFVNPKVSLILSDVEINSLSNIGKCLLIGSVSKGLLSLNTASTNLQPKVLVSDRINSMTLVRGELWAISDYVIYRKQIGGISDLNDKGFSSTSNSKMDMLYNRIWSYDDNIYLETNKGIKILITNNLSSRVSVLTKIQNDSATSTYKPENNDVEISYHSVCYDRPLDDTYRYRLIGSDTGSWVYTNDENVTLQNVAHGDYRFEVMSRNINNVWSEPAYYEFTILPRFHETTWFKFILVITPLSFLGLGLFTYRERSRKKAMRDKVMDDYKKRLNFEKENSLRQQMNPHFVFNAINSIQLKIVENLTKGDEQILAKFSALLRSSLLLSKDRTASLKDEVKFISEYIALEQYNRSPTVECEIMVNIKNTADVMIPPLMLQPLIENTFKHAFTKSNHQHKLSIKIDPIWTLDKSLQDYLEVTILDNGVGFDLSKPKSTINHMSMAVDAIRNRLRIFNQGVPNPLGSLIFLDANPNDIFKGTKVVLIMPAWLKDKTTNPA